MPGATASPFQTPHLLALGDLTALTPAKAWLSGNQGSIWEVSEEELEKAKDLGSVMTMLRKDRGVGPSATLGEQGAFHSWTFPWLRTSCPFSLHPPHQHFCSCILSKQCGKTTGAPMASTAMPGCVVCSRIQSRAKRTFGLMPVHTAPHSVGPGKGTNQSQAAPTP